MAGCRLTLRDRFEIQCGISRNESDSVIGERVGKHRTTISREICRHGGRDSYGADQAQEVAVSDSKRPKPERLDDPGLVLIVEAGLTKKWSPAAIAMGTGGLISAETIYKAVYARAAGPLSVAACRGLVSKRRARRCRTPKEAGKRNVLGPIKPVAARPIEAANREPGHWEGDLIMGTKNRSAIVTVVCRASRMTFTADLPEGHTAPEVTAALSELFDRIPTHLHKTLTWDQGREMAGWVTAEQIIPALKIFFCEPHSPWQRPTNENTNGILRRWLPKGTDLHAYKRIDLDHIETNINTMPRRLFKGKSAHDIYHDYATITSDTCATTV